jgi:lipoprotein-anchoring transpeptidase ErfK/SrfK
MDRRAFVKLAALTTFAPGVALAAHPAVEGEEPYAISWGDTKKVARRFRRQRVGYRGKEPPGTIIVDTASKYLYLVEPGAKAMRYGIGVGRQGFSWSGRAVIRRKAKWPRWTPPAEMVARDSYAAEWADGMPGGPTNPLGARALYLFQGGVDTLYRIHGTYQPGSIGRAVSSGCIRLLNADVVDLYERVRIGAEVVVLQRRLDAVAIEERRKEATPPPVIRRNFNLNLGR